MKYIIAFLMVTASSSCKSQDNRFIAQRVSNSAEILLNGTVKQVFPLFGIMKEKEWSSGWSPTALFPQSGQMAEGSVFRTPGHVHGEPPLTWVVSRYDSAAAHLTYIIEAANRIVSIDIRCTALPDNRTRATIAYTMTGLSDDGNAIIHHAITKQFAENLQDWQTAINKLLTP
jgi:hypothetical protein